MSSSPLSSLEARDLVEDDKNNVKDVRAGLVCRCFPMTGLLLELAARYQMPLYP